MHLQGGVTFPAPKVIVRPTEVQTCTSQTVWRHIYKYALLWASVGLPLY